MITISLKMHQSGRNIKQKITTIYNNKETSLKDVNRNQLRVDTVLVSKKLEQLVLTFQNL